MDSGNSNSMQSSSGDEEYDSRAESISSFLNNNNNPSSYPPPPAPAPAQQHQLHHHHPSNLFDPLPSNYTFDPLSSSNPNSLLNLDMVWSKRLRSDQPNCNDLGGLFIPSTSLSFSSSPALPHIPRGGGVITTDSVSKASSFSGPYNNNNNNSNTLMMRNPKKRSRASRRAPTTVLTTDTTNFRAMVQEFTGIPAPPFTSSSSPFSRTRLDLFGNSSRSTPSAYSPSPSYSNLLRPFAQKLINPIPFTSSNSMIDSIASASTTAPAATTTYISNYQPLPSQNLLNINMQNNPILNLQSLLQLPPKYPLSNSSILETKPPTTTTQGSSLEELGLSHAAGTASHLNTNLMSGLQSWPGTGAGAAAAGSNENREELGLFANGKLTNFSQVNNGHENVNVAAAAATATRPEGMVESWICSSD